MSENLTALASENLNSSLRSLLEDVARGYIQVPRFQRPFVWTDAQRLDLLRSIRDNMPIGSLLVWRTSKFRLAVFPKVGPHHIPKVAEHAPSTGWQYLLDGHQRVSTLVGLLLQAPAFENHDGDEDGTDWNIQYDLIDQDFIFAKKVIRHGTIRPLLNLSSLLDGRLVNRQMREIRKLADFTGWSDDELDVFEERADQLAYRFQQYRIPIVVMVADDLDLAARTFQRINSLGTPMSESHLVAALTWRSDFDLRELLNDLRATFPPGWREVDEGLILQVCKGLAGLDMTKAGQTELVKRLTGDSMILERAGSALRETLYWLSERAGVVHEELLPYSFQVVLLALEFDRRKGLPIPEAAFSRWFWRTSWSEVFATAAFRDVKLEQDALQQAVDEGAPMMWMRDDALPSRFDFRSARVRLFVLRLASRQHITLVDGSEANGRSLLAAHGRDAFVRLFPSQKESPRDTSPRLKALLQGVGNRFLLRPGTENILRDHLKFDISKSEAFMTSNFITPEALSCLQGGDLLGFLTMRTIEMEHWDYMQWQEAQT